MAETQLNSNRFTHVVAFEVSKASLLVEARPGGARREIANTPHQVRGLLRREMKRNRDGQLGPLLVVCEASGGYACHGLAVATELGLACHRAHGTRVRYFARFRGRDAKSDGLDVGVLAAYGLDPGSAPHHYVLRRVRDDGWGVAARDTPSPLQCVQTCD
jgi:transposase